MLKSVEPNRRFTETAVASVTAVFLYSKSPSKKLLSTLGEVKKTPSWKLVMEVVDKGKAESFRVVRVPVMLLYNEAGVETARVIGEENITSTVRKLLDNE